MENKSLNESIISIRVKLQNAKLKKSGKNKFAGFDYFELADFLPKLNELMLEEGVNDRFYIKDNYAILELQKCEEINTYTIPFILFETPLTYKKDKDGNFVKNKEGDYIQVPSMQDIQYLGALNTYYKRYLYLNAFGITDGEVIDSMNNEEMVSEPKAERKATDGQIAVLNKLSDEDKAKVYVKFGVKAIEELTLKQASELISKLKGNK